MIRSKDTVIKRGSTLLLRLAIFVIGSIVLALCIFALPSMWNAVAEEYPEMTYVFYGILLALYLSAIPFFFALFQALKLLSYIDRNKAFSNLSVRALKRIAFCGVAIGIVFSAVMPLIFLWADDDDAPGLIVFWALIIGASLTVSVFASVMQRVLQQAIDIKTENDLTV